MSGIKRNRRRKYLHEVYSDPPWFDDYGIELRIVGCSSSLDVQRFLALFEGVLLAIFPMRGNEC